MLDARGAQGDQAHRGRQVARRDLMPPGGGMAYVAVNGDNFVAVIDLKTWQVTKEDPDRYRPRRHGVDPVIRVSTWLSQDPTVRPWRVDDGVVRRRRRRDLRPDRSQRRRQDRRRWSASRGCARPIAARISVLGLDPFRDVYALQERIGVQLQQAQLQKRIKVWEAVAPVGVALPTKPRRRRPAARAARSRRTSATPGS